MNRRVILSIAGAMIAGAVGLVAVHARQDTVFIAGDQPVSEDQVRTKLQADGWSGVQIARDGRYYQVIGSRNGVAAKMTIDAQTGRLRDDDDDDDD